MAGPILRTAEATHWKLHELSPLAVVVLTMLLAHVGRIACEEVTEVGLVFTEEPADIVVVRGTSIVWNCSAMSSDGASPPNMTWFKDGQVISDNRRFVLQNGSLFIQKIIHNLRRGVSDEDLYECMATNEFGSILSRPASLRVAYLNASRTTVSRHIAERGEMARFDCDIEGLPKPKIVWLRNDDMLPQDDSRFVLLNSGVLQVYPIITSDSGSYQCRGENEVDSKLGSTHELTVVTETNENPNSEPRFVIKPPLNTTVKVGETFQWECAVSSRDADVFWRRQDRSPLQDRVHIIGRSNLELRNAAVLDTSVYQCVYGTQTVGIALLEVVERPRVETNTPYVEVHVGSSTILECEYGGMLAVDMTWTKDGYPLNMSRRLRFSENTLSITSVLASDSGYYQCWADNQAGSSYAVIQLTVPSADESPSPPTGLKVRSIDSRTVELSWSASPPRYNRTTFAYSVHYHPVAGGTELQLVATETSQIVAQLTPYTNYTFYVIAYNPRSQSRRSASIYFVTDESVPTAQPSVNLTVLNASALLVEWSELSPERARGKIAQYQLYYRQRQDDPPLVTPPSAVTINGTLRQYIITDVVVGAVYEVLVLACTKAGCSSKEDRWIWYPKVVTYQDAPVALYCETINETAVLLSWAANGTKPYTVRFRFAGMADSRALITDKESVTVAGLEPYTLYEFKVYSSGHADELLHEAVSCMTAEGFPTEPLDVQTTVRKSSSESQYVDILLSWRQPARSNGIVTSYNVHWTISAEIPDDEWSTKIVNGSTRTVLSAVSTESQRCFLKLSASTSRGVGQWTSTITVGTVVVTPAISELELGIIIGVSVGFICIIVCVTVLILRHRYKDIHQRQSAATPRHHPEDISGRHGDSEMPTYRNSNNAGQYYEAENEMNCWAPMLSNDTGRQVQWHQTTSFPGRSGHEMRHNNTAKQPQQRSVKADESRIPLCIDTSMSFTVSNPNSPCEKSAVDAVDLPVSDVADDQVERDALQTDVVGGVSEAD